MGWKDEIKSALLGADNNNQDDSSDSEIVDGEQDTVIADSISENMLGDFLEVFKFYVNIWTKEMIEIPVLYSVNTRLIEERDTLCYDFRIIKSYSLKDMNAKKEEYILETTLIPFEIKVISNPNEPLDNMISPEDEVLIQNFVKKYGMYPKEEHMLMIKNLLTSKGYDIGDSDLLALMFQKGIEQDCMKFSEMVMSTKPQSLRDYVRVYCDITNNDLDFLKNHAIFASSENLKLYIKPIKKLACNRYYLTMLCKENNIDEISEYENFEEFLSLVDDIKKESNLEIFEKSLMQDKIYSIEEIDLMDGYKFEEFLKYLFENLGYIVEQTKLSGDYGADLVASKFNIKTVVQAKRSQSAIGNGAIQEVLASINYYKAQKGMVVTNSSFTKSAIELAEVNNIELWNRDRLVTVVSNCQSAFKSVPIISTKSVPLAAKKIKSELPFVACIL